MTFNLVLGIGSEADVANIFINSVEKEVFTMKSPSLPMTLSSSGYWNAKLIGDKLQEDLMKLLVDRELTRDPQKGQEKYTEPMHLGRK